MKIILRIIRFHNCDGCARKVRKAARRIGVELVGLDRESGTVTITTAEPPEVIRLALERKLKKPVVVVTENLVPTNQNPNFVVPHLVNRALDLQDLGQIMLRLVEVLDGAEITIRFNLNHRENPLVVRPDRGGVRIRDANDDDRYASPRPPPRSPPWAATEPSAPRMSTPDQQAFYGYPPDYYGIYTTRNNNHDHPNE